MDMKKLLSIVLVLSLCVTVAFSCCLNASAESFVSEIYTYEIIDDNVKITKVDKNATGDIVIPQYLSGFDVTVIGSCAFIDCNKITSVTIQNGVKEIEAQAFTGCTQMTSITIPNSVTEIGTEAFSYCDMLTEVQLPNSIKSIESKLLFKENVR